MTPRMLVHDRDCDTLRPMAPLRTPCSCREQRHDRKARRDQQLPRGLFDGAVSLGDGNYWTRPLGSNNDGY